MQVEPEVIEAHDVASRTYGVVNAERIREASKRCWCWEDPFRLQVLSDTNWPCWRPGRCDQQGHIPLKLLTVKINILTRQKLFNHVGFACAASAGTNSDLS